MREIFVLTVAGFTNIFSFENVRFVELVVFPNIVWFDSARFAELVGFPRIVFFDSARFAALDFRRHSSSTCTVLDLPN